MDRENIEGQNPMTAVQILKVKFVKMFKDKLSLATKIILKFISKLEIIYGCLITLSIYKLS